MAAAVGGGSGEKGGDKASKVWSALCLANATLKGLEAANGRSQAGDEGVREGECCRTLKGMTVVCWRVG